MSNDTAKNQSSKLKKILGSDLQENVELKNYTTMKVGGVADYFFVARTIDELIKAILVAKKLNMAYFILGGGSNIIVSDYGFAGLVILNRTSSIVYISDHAQAIVDSGVSLARLVMDTASHGLGGLEHLIGIPGTVGGAIYGNAGAYGVAMSNFVKSITLLSSEGKIIRCNTRWLNPSYRKTKLKIDKKSGKEISVILSVKLQLATNKKEEIMRKIQYYQKTRDNKVPYNKPSAGSIFKNPGDLTRSKIGIHKPDEPVKSAGYLLEQIEAKKLRVGGARVSQMHANFVINDRNAKAEEIRQLIEELRNKVQDKYGIFLEEEVEYVGQWK